MTRLTFRTIALKALNVATFVDRHWVLQTKGLSHFASHCTRPS